MSRSSTSVARRAALVFVFIWFFVGGIAHFAATASFASIVPSYVPLPTLVVYVSGVFELAGAVGLCLSAWRALAAWELILVTMLVTPANVSMLEHAADYPSIPVWVLIARLPVQLVLILIIAYAGGLIGREGRPIKANG